MSASSNSLTTLNSATAPTILTSGYLTFVAATAFNTNQMLITNTGTSLLKMAVGAAGSETDLFQIPPSGTVLIQIPTNSVLAGSRLSLRAIDTTQASGYVALTLFA